VIKSDLEVLLFRVHSVTDALELSANPGHVVFSHPSLCRRIFPGMIHFIKIIFYPRYRLLHVSVFFPVIENVRAGKGPHKTKDQLMVLPIIRILRTITEVRGFLDQVTKADQVMVAQLQSWMGMVR
jgi:hypothetical protein